MKNLDINVDPINDAVFKNSVPALRFSRIMVNTLSVEAPIMNLKNKPVTFFIDHLFVEIAEEMTVRPSLPKKPAKKAVSAKYGFVDRVLDCLSFEVNRITIAVRTLGRIKTGTVGPWTPPVALFELFGARVFCTNHNGFESELDECIRVRQTKRPLMFLYKKLEVERASMHLVNPEIWGTVAVELIKQMPAVSISGLNLGVGARGYVSLKIFDNALIQVMMCTRKRVDNNFLLGLEIAITIEVLKINLRQKCLSEFIHFILGMQFCLFRLDSVQMLFGPDPYNEGFVSSTISEELGMGLGAASAAERRKIRLNQFGKAESESLDKLEAEMVTGAATISEEEDRGEDWQRSSLNSDDDPPRMRFVTVVQINDASIVFHLDSPKNEKNENRSTDSINTQKHSSNVDIQQECGNRIPVPKPIPPHVHALSRAAPPKVVIVHLTGCVHTSISPEHAAVTDSVSQTTFKSLTITGNNINVNFSFNM